MGNIWDSIPIGQAKVLCSTCGQAHALSSPCPPINCKACGTTHARNNDFTYNNCENNEQFRKWFKEHKDWQKQNTDKIWNQSDKEPEED